MRAHTRIALIGLAAAFTLAVAVGASDARRFLVSSQPIRMAWIEGVTFTSSPADIVVKCEITLEGSFHSATISKVSGSLIGHITRIGINACPGNGIHTRVSGTGLPWKIIYTNFTGTLPNIASIRSYIEGIGFLFEGPSAISGFNLACLYTSSATTGEFGAFLELTAGTVTSVRADERVAFDLTMTLRESQTVCPSRVTPSMSGRLTVLGRETAVTIRLVQ